MSWISAASLLLYALTIESIYALTAPKPIQRVAVIGSGIAGLATAHALSELDVAVFDARRGLDRGAGAGVQLNGGLAVLGKISRKLQQAVYEAGQPVRGIRSRGRSTTSDDAYETLLELSIRDVIEKAGGETKRSLIQDDRVLWVSIMRGALQETLYDELPTPVREKVQFDKLLTGLIGVAGGGIECEFADGTTAGPFDLVVGCDGVKSAVKEYIDRGQISPDPSQREGKGAGLYSGIRIRYAVRDGSEADEQEEASFITQYFGDSAYCFDGKFGAGRGRPPSRCAFITYLDEDYIGPFQRRKQAESVAENADWSQDVRKSTDVYRGRMAEQLAQCHVPGTAAQQTVAEADRFFELGVYAHSPFCSWSKEVPGSSGAFCVLAGDAAHATPPFLGQGSNQAIQDAYCLGQRIADYNREVSAAQESLETEVRLLTFLKDYEHTRWPATFQVFWKASFLGYLETGGLDGLYSRFRDFFFKTMGILGVAQRVLLSAATPKV